MGQRTFAVDGKVLVLGQRARVVRVDALVARLAPREPRGDARIAADAAAVVVGAARRDLVPLGGVVRSHSWLEPKVDLDPRKRQIRA